MERHSIGIIHSLVAVSKSALTKLKYSQAPPGTPTTKDDPIETRLGELQTAAPRRLGTPNLVYANFSQFRSPQVLNTLSNQLDDSV